jgi:hypothetical protein
MRKKKLHRERDIVRPRERFGVAVPATIWYAMVLWWWFDDAITATGAFISSFSISILSCYLFIDFWVVNDGLVMRIYGDWFDAWNWLVMKVMVLWWLLWCGGYTTTFMVFSNTFLRNKWKSSPKIGIGDILWMSPVKILQWPKTVP